MGAALLGRRRSALEKRQGLKKTGRGFWWDMVRGLSRWLRASGQARRTWRSASHSSACAGDGLQMFTHALLLPQVREGWGTTGTLRNKKGPKAANTDCAKCPANYLRYVTDWVLLGVSV